MLGKLDKLNVVEYLFSCFSSFNPFVMFAPHSSEPFAHEFYLSLFADSDYNHEGQTPLFLRDSDMCVVSFFVVKTSHICKKLVT